MSGDDAYYRKLAEASMTLIGERRLSANGVDLLKVNYFYLRELGLRDEAQLPPDHAINPRALERAFVLAHRDMNGSNARAWADIVRPR